MKVSGAMNAEIETVMVEAEGNTLLEAMRNMISISTQKLYLGHCRVLIIGEDIAKEGLNPILDLMLSHHEIRIDTDLVIAKGKTAYEIIKQKPVVSPVPSYAIMNLLNNNERYWSQSKRNVLYQMINILDTSSSPVMPSLEIEKTDNYSTNKLSGLAVFNKDKLVGYLDNEESKYYLFATNKVYGGEIVTKMDVDKELYVGVEILKNDTSFIHEYKDDKLEITLKTKTKVILDEIEKDVDYTSKAGA